MQRTFKLYMIPQSLLNTNYTQEEHIHLIINILKETGKGIINIYEESFDTHRIIFPVLHVFLQRKKQRSERVRQLFMPITEEVFLKGAYLPSEFPIMDLGDCFFFSFIYFSNVFWLYIFCQPNIIPT